MLSKGNRIMNSKTKTPVKKHGARCQNCKSEFVIEPEDFEFYKKIDVPAPTFCPDCRAQRRFAFRNILSFYKGKCDFSNKDIISIYRLNGLYKVYDSKIWWSDKWDPMDYGVEYDFSEPFLKQFKELLLKVPKAHTLNINSVNCDYCAATVNSKNCYLSTCNTCEDCAYTIAIRSNNCFDVFWIVDSENCYENTYGNNNYSSHFIEYSDNCIDSLFLYDCRNCQNCFGCVNLKHKKYHIFNKKYSKTEYFKKLEELNIGNYREFLKIKKQFDEFKLKFPRRYARIYKSHNAIGDNLNGTNNCQYCFGSLKGLENSKYIHGGGNNLKDSYDIFDAGTNAELIYDSVSVGLGAGQVFFSVIVVDGSYNIEYSDNCYNSSNLFGCVSLKHKKYCILNKQYTKEEYEKLVPKIKRHMDEMPYIDKKGRVYKYGEFFPLEFSPFDYNKSVAQEHFPLSEKEALKQGYKWRKESEQKYQPTILSKDIPNDIKDVNMNITKEVIECGNNNCTSSGVFRIISQEFKFLKKHGLPLPRFCPECRMWQRLERRNPHKLWKRQCMKKGCNTKFQTTYSPDRKEIIYCEKCYQKEIE